MSNINVIAQLVPKNDANFALADTIHLKGGYIQVASKEELSATLAYTNRLKEGMLAFVVSERKFYQLLEDKWKIWQPESGASLVLHSVANTEALHTSEGSSLEVKGQVVYVEDIDTLLYYSGSTWNSFTRIYIQDTAPNDKTGIWIDSTGSGLNESSSVVSDLYRLVNILAKKVSQLEYMNQQIQSGTFSNNMYDEYNNIIGIDPGDEISGITDEDESDGTTEEEDYTEEQLLANTLLADSQEPTTYKDTLPNVKHIQIKYGKYEDMIKNKNNFLAAELLYCFDLNELYIVNPKTYQLVKIGATSSGGDDTPIDDDIMNGIIQNGDYISSISFVDMVDTDKHYTFSVKHGKLDLYNEELEVEPIATNQTLLSGSDTYYSTPYYPTATNPYESTNYNSMLRINMVYASGNVGAVDTNPCNYNFIELANLTQEDINLNGYYLHYSEGETTRTTRNWVTLPLKGIIKAQSTYLIKGARAGLDKFAKIKVGDPDIYFSKNVAKNPNIFESSIYSIWDDEGMLKINNICAFYLTGPFMALEGKTNKEASDYVLSQGSYACSDPWNRVNNSYGVLFGFVDLVGFGSGMPNIGEKASVEALNPNRIVMPYYIMDNVQQAYKSVVSKNTVKWIYVDLINTPQEIDVEAYSPKNSTEGKNMFFNKHLLKEGTPQFVTCTFGYNPHTTRCFTWVSVGYRDEYLRYRKQGTEDWTAVESFKAGDGREAVRNRENDIYNRIRSVTTDGTYFTSHKCIIDLYDPEGNGPEATETWEYQVGYDKNWTDIHTFTLRNRETVKTNGFEFVQVTDQQGFNQEEYEEWRLVAEAINREFANAKEYEYTYLTQEELNSATIKTEVPTTDEEENIFIISGYYEKVKTESGYEYQEVTDTAEQEEITYRQQGAIKDFTASETSLNSFVLGKGYKLTKHDIEFTINTGDATQNGNRINEWVDYFKAGDVLFSKFEQMYSVGNNDLCPVIPYKLGLGTDITKQNPINVNYFFTFEHPFEVPVSSTGIYVPCFYSFVYGNTYFLCANSELASECEALFGQQGGPLYQTLKGWCERDLEHVTNPDWKIAFCHENPFTLLISSVVNEYLTEVNKDPSYTAINRGKVTSHFNSPGNFWFSKFLEDNHFNLSICGHKHTYTTSRYMHDNEANRMKPFVYDEAGENAEYVNDTNKKYMEVTNDTTKWYVKYTMCQATGYKLVSNKELPCANIGWLESYYPTDGSNSNKGQLYPHFIIWKVGKGTETESPTGYKLERPIILGKAKKVYPHFDKIISIDDGSNKLFNYNTRNFTSDVLRIIGGNGENSDNNIIVEKLPFTPTYKLTWEGDTGKVTGGTAAGTYVENTSIEYPTAITGYSVTFDKQPATLTEDTTITITATSTE